MNTSSQHTEKQTEGEHSNHFVTEIQGARGRSSLKEVSEADAANAFSQPAERREPSEHSMDMLSES